MKRNNFMTPSTHKPAAVPSHKKQVDPFTNFPSNQPSQTSLAPILA